MEFYFILPGSRLQPEESDINIPLAWYRKTIVWCE